MNRSEPRKRQTPASDSPAATEQIRMRAYELYRERGSKAGDDMADWLRAESEYLERAPRAETREAAHRTSSRRPLETTA